MQAKQTKNNSDDQILVQALRRRDLIMEAISIAAEEFLQTPNLDMSIQDAIVRLGKATDASRVYIFQNQWIDDDDLGMHLLFESCADGVKRMGENSVFDKISYQSEGFIRWMELLSRNMIIIGNIEDFPENERKLLAEEYIRSLLVIPIIVDLDWWGFIGFDSVVKEKAWYKEEIDALRLAANILGAAFRHKQMEKALQSSWDRFRTMADYTHDWEYWMAPDGKFIYSSPAFNTITGYNLEYVQQDMGIFRRISHPEDLERVERYIQGLLTSQESGTVDFRIVTQGGEERWISHISKPIYDQKGIFLGLRASNRDVTNQKIAEEELRQANDALNQYVDRLERINRQVILLNEMGDKLQSSLKVEDVYSLVVEYCSKLFINQSGALYILDNTQQTYTLAVYFGGDPNFKKSFSYNSCWAIQRGRPHLVDNSGSKLVCRHVSEAGGPADFSPYICAPLIAHKQKLGLLHIKDIPENETDGIMQLVITVAERSALAIANLNLREQLRIQSIVDPLTGLFNRRFMTDTLDREIKRANRQGYNFAVVMIDIDRFKQYNDMYGHDTGDVIIQALAAYFKKAIRSEDYACRYGGDEFTLILPGASLKFAENRVDEIRKGIKDLKIQAKGKSMAGISISVGIAYFPDHGKTENEILKAADTALYKAKESGRNRVVVAEIMD